MNDTIGDDLRFTIVKRLGEAGWIEEPVYYTDIQECLDQAKTSMSKGFEIAILINLSDKTDD